MQLLKRILAPVLTAAVFAVGLGYASPVAASDHRRSGEDEIRSVVVKSATIVDVTFSQPLSKDVANPKGNCDGTKDLVRGPNTSPHFFGDHNEDGLVNRATGQRVPPHHHFVSKVEVNGATATLTFCRALHPRAFGDDFTVELKIRNVRLANGNVVNADGPEIFAIGVKR
jgi:hypothetical protein